MKVYAVYIIVVHKLHRRLVHPESRKKLDVDDHHVGLQSLPIIPEIKRSLNHSCFLICSFLLKTFLIQLGQISKSSSIRKKNNLPSFSNYAYYLRKL